MRQLCILEGSKVGYANGEIFFFEKDLNSLHTQDGVG